MVPSDYDEIYRWSTDPRTTGLWRYRGRTPSPDTVVRQLWEGATVLYCVCTSDNRQPFGLVALYNSNQVSQYCYLSALAAPEVLGTGLVVRGVLQLVEYGFARFRLRKIYLESLSSSLSQFGSATRLGLLSEEGRLREHEWNGSGFDDLVFLSVSAEQWNTYRETRGLHA